MAVWSYEVSGAPHGPVTQKGTHLSKHVLEPAAQEPFGVDPKTEAERTEAAELAVFLLRENLSPAELAAYVLRKAFDCPSPHISKILQLGVASPSSLVLRAAGRLAAGRLQPAKPAANRHVMRAFLAASRIGNLADLEDLLAADLADHPTRWPTGRKR